MTRVRRDGRQTSVPPGTPAPEGRIELDLQQLERLLRHAGETIVVFRSDGTVVYGNAAIETFARRLELTESPSIHDYDRAFVFQDEAGLPLPEAEKPTARVLAGETFGPTTYTFRHESGISFTGSISGIRIQDEPFLGALIFRDESAARSANLALRRRDAILEAAAFAAERLLRWPDWRNAIDDVLERLGIASEASRAYLFENATDDGILTCSQSHEWVADGIEPEIDNPRLQHVPYAEVGLGRWIDVLSAGDPILGSVSHFPPEEQSVFEEQGILSLAVVPIFVHGRWWGFVGFDECRTERHWSTSEVDALRLAASTLGAAIARSADGAALAGVRSRLEMLLWASPVIIYAFTPGAPNVMSYCSENVREQLGYDPADFVTKPDFWLGRVHPDDRRLALTERPPGTGVLVREYRFLHRDGSYRWTRDISRLVVSEDGSSEVVGCWFDITARRHAEDMFRKAFRLAPVAACLTSRPDGHVLDVNDHFVHVTGYAREDAIGRNHTEIGLWSDPEEMHTAEARLSEDGGYRDIELRVRTRHGVTLTVSASAEILALEDDSITLHMFSDISERKQTEEQIMEAVRAVMSDAAWFSRSVMAKLAQLKAGAADPVEITELTPRERQVLSLVARGRSNEAIAGELHLAPQTVRNYISIIYEKIGVNSRAQAVVWARERGLVGPPS